MQDIKNELIGELKFGYNKILVDSTGKFTIHFGKDNEWSFDFDEIKKLDTILSDFEQVTKGKAEKVFWRTNGSKFIQVKISFDRMRFFPPDLSRIVLTEGGTRTAWFYRSESHTLRENIQILTSNESSISRKTVEEFVNSKDFTKNPPFSESIFGIPSKKYSYDLFVLMPFTLNLKPVYDNHIKKVAKAQNLSIARADDFFSQNSIVFEVWSAITQASILIADCTGKNPNVFYEIGIAHALGKPVILITQNQDDVPFDLRHIRYIYYDYTPSGIITFENSLATTILEIMKDISD